jgi:two-component system response regulator FixJ
MASALTPFPIFLVDDDEAMRDSLGLLLQLEGFDVQEYGSAAAFLAAFEPGKTGAQGCLVLDLQIPGMSGLDFLRRHHDRLVDWTVIMMSGNASHADKHEARALGVRRFLDMPFDGGDLIAELKQIFSTAQCH